ncbi:MAG: hypothetical protein QMO91_02345 [Candidatus Tisiphia sp.]|nr:hypothetical protein [Candidatus Tisiphia sp.]
MQTLLIIDDTDIYPLLFENHLKTLALWHYMHCRFLGSVASIIEDLLEATKLRFWTLCNH